MRVVGNHLAGSPKHRENDLLCRATLMCGNDVLEREKLLHRGLEAEPRGGSGIALVTVLNRRPLIPRHCTGARIGQQIDKDVLRVQVEEIKADALDGRLALCCTCHAKWLDRMNAERLDDGVEGLIHASG